MTDIVENSNKQGEISVEFREIHLPELNEILTGNDKLKIALNLDLSISAVRNYLSGIGVNKVIEYNIIKFSVDYLIKKIEFQLKNLKEINTNF